MLWSVQIVIGWSLRALKLKLTVTETESSAEGSLRDSVGETVSAALMVPIFLLGSTVYFLKGMIARIGEIKSLSVMVHRRVMAGLRERVHWMTKR